MILLYLIQNNCTSQICSFIVCCSTSTYLMIKSIPVLLRTSSIRLLAYLLISEVLPVPFSPPNWILIKLILKAELLNMFQILFWLFVFNTFNCLIKIIHLKIVT